MAEGGGLEKYSENELAGGTAIRYLRVGCISNFIWFCIVCILDNIFTPNQVGSVGLNLTGADRVVICESSIKLHINQ